MIWCVELSHTIIWCKHAHNLQDKDNWSPIKINWTYTKCIGQEMEGRLWSRGKSQILMIIYYFVYMYVKCVKHMLWMEGV